MLFNVYVFSEHIVLSEHSIWINITMYKHGAWANGRLGRLGAGGWMQPMSMPVNIIMVRYIVQYSYILKIRYIVQYSYVLRTLCVGQYSYVFRTQRVSNTYILITSHVFRTRYIFQYSYVLTT